MIREEKKKEVSRLVKLVEKYPVVGIINFKNLPNRHLQRIRKKLRNKAKLRIAKKNLIDLSFERCKDKGVEELSKYMEGEVGLILTKMDPFKLSVLLEKLKTSAPPKANWIPEKDIIVPKGSTPFLPGPMVGELQSLGLPARIKSGRVIIRKNTVLVKAGEKVGEEKAKILKQLRIKPMVVGLRLLGAYDGKLIYSKDVLTIDIEATKEDLLKAYNQAFNLAYNSFYPIEDNIKLFLKKAINQARNLAINAEVFESETISILLRKVYNQILSLKSEVK